MKVLVVFPAATVTLAGTVTTALLLLESEMLTPPLGAGAVRFTVPVAEFPPTTLEGLRLRELRAVVVCGNETLVLLPDPPHEFNVIAKATTASNAGSPGRRELTRSRLTKRHKSKKYAR